MYDGAEETCLRRQLHNSDFGWSNKPNDNIIVQFLNETSLHGLKYVGQRNRHFIEKIFWVAAFTCGIVLAGFLIEDVWHKFGTNPVILAFDPNEIPIARIPFPAITICNANKVRKDIVLEIERNSTSSDPEVRRRARNELHGINYVCSSKPSLFRMINRGQKQQSVIQEDTNIIDLIHKVGQPCEEMIDRCFIGGSEIPCGPELHPIVTETGLCCTFNLYPLQLLLDYPEMLDSEINDESVAFNEMSKSRNDLWRQWDFKKGYVGGETRNYSGRPLKQFKPGRSFGLSLLLYPDLDNYYCTTGDSFGFKTVVHSPLELPHPHGFGFTMSPRAEVFTNIIPDLTISDEKIRNVEIASRHCLFEGELPLKYFAAYTHRNCIDECGTNYTLKACGCVWYYQPHDKETRLCGNDDMKCTNALAGIYGNNKNNSATSILANTARGVLFCNFCYPLCNDLDFRLEVSQSPLQDYARLVPVGGIGNITRSAWYGHPVTVLNIFYGQRTVIPKVRKKLFETTDLIASIGGLLGFCLGFSWLSAVELIYFFSMRPWFKWRSLGAQKRRMWMKLKHSIKKLKYTGTTNDMQIVPAIDMHKQKINFVRLTVQPFVCQTYH